jgi:hypothetical protein
MEPYKRESFHRKGGRSPASPPLHSASAQYLISIRESCKYLEIEMVFISIEKYAHAHAFVKFELRACLMESPLLRLNMSDGSDMTIYLH